MVPYSPSRKAVVLLLAVVFAAPLAARTSADTGAGGPSRSAILNSKRVARHIFKPHCRWVHVEVRRETPNPLYVGQAMAPCRVVIRRGSYTFLRICALIVHEYGHLAGYKHSADPDDIMFPGRPPRYAPCVRREAAMQRRTARASRSASRSRR